MHRAAVFVIAGLLCTQAGSDPLTTAETMYRAGNFKEAIRSFCSLAASNPQSERAQVGLVRSLLKNDDADEARAAGDSAMKAIPSSAAIRAAVGDIVLRKGDFSEARMHYDAAIRMDPLSARGYYGLARIHYSDFNRKTAGALARKACELDPEDPEIILACAGSSPAQARIPLLEKYLKLGATELPERLASALCELEYLRKAGNRKTWQLVGEPRSEVIPLRSEGRRAGVYSGYSLKAVINGKKAVNLLLDTGSHGLLLRTKQAEKLGIEAVSPCTIYGVGDGRVPRTNTGFARSVQVGGVEFRDCRVEYSDARSGQGTDGVIGADVFKSFLVTLDFPKQKLELSPLPPVKGIPHDDPDCWDNLDRTLIPEFGEFNEVRQWQGLLLDVMVNDLKRGWFFLDTGASDHVIDRSLAAQLTSVRSVGRLVSGILGSAETYKAARIKLQFDQYLQRTDEMYAISLKYMSRLLGVEISGLLGRPILNQLAVSIDYRDGLIRFSHPTQR